MMMLEIIFKNSSLLGCYLISILTRILTVYHCFSTHTHALLVTFSPSRRLVGMVTVNGLF